MKITIIYDNNVYQKGLRDDWGFSCLIEAEEGNDSFAFCKKLLKEAKVSTTPGIAFGHTGENHLRLSFCVSEDMINKAFDRMEKYF